MFSIAQPLPPIPAGYRLNRYTATPLQARPHVADTLAELEQSLLELQWDVYAEVITPDGSTMVAYLLDDGSWGDWAGF